MSRLTRDGTAEPVLRDQILRHERGQGNIHFSCSADHVQDWQPYPVDPCSCYMCDRYSYQQGSKSRQQIIDSTNNGTDQRQNGSSNLLTPYREQPRSTRIVVATHGQRPQQQSGQITPQSVLIKKPKFFKATHDTEIRKIGIPRSMVVEALSW